MISHDIRTPYMLSERHFMMTVLVAIILHASGFVAYSIAPKQLVQDIPIRTLNIRLGDADEAEVEQPPVNFSANAPQIEAMIDQLTRDTPLTPPPPPVATPPAPDSVKQYVREINVPKSLKTDRNLKKGARDAEVMSRYTQLISLWIQKFKLYPEEARALGVKGTPVVRIRIDRRGNLRYYAIERTGGHPALDRAAIDMIRRANPVPAVPADFQAGDSFEFLIPVNFSL